MAEESNARVCPRCGNTIPAEAAECAHRWGAFLRSRETVLSLCAVSLVIFFFFTGMVTRAYHAKVHALAGEWFAAGEAKLKANDAPAALADFRNALVYDPENAAVQFRLAQALMAESRDEEARSYLLGLLAHTPSDAPVNLALARLAASSASETDALRYYHGAIYGVWPTDAETNRLKARLELCRFLIARGDTSSAEGELVALESEIPEQQGAAHEQVGELFLGVGDASRALAEFQRALAMARPPASAWRGAGVAAYQRGDFGEAEKYLERASRLRANDAEGLAGLETSRLILAWDPDARGLDESQRRERARHDFAQGVGRLQSCAESAGANLSGSGGKQTDLTKLYARAKAMELALSDRSLARHPEQLDGAMDLVFEIESATAQACGEPGGLDKALALLGKYRQGRER